MTLQRILYGTLLATVVAVSPAAGQDLLDAYGNASLARIVGGTTNVYALMRAAPPTTTPLNLDTAAFQYTVVISGLTLDDAGDPQTHSGGTVSIYEDAGTPADLGDIGTFVDGATILQGEIVSLERNVLLETLASLDGTLNWTGGSQLGQIAPADGWKLLGAANRKSADSRFDEAWDFKIEPPQVSAPVEERSWSGVKDIFGSQ